MAESELDKIRKLPPKERLAKLKELEDRKKAEEKKRLEEAKKQEIQAKKDAEDAKRMIEESLGELKLDEMLKEIDVPKQDRVDVQRLLDSSAVEEEAKRGKIHIKQEDYTKRIEELLPKNTLNEIQNWYRQDSDTPTREEFLEVYDRAREAYDTLKDQMQRGPDQQYRTASQELTEEVVGSMKLLRSMGYKMNFFEP